MDAGSGEGSAVVRTLKLFGASLLLALAICCTVAAINARLDETTRPRDLHGSFASLLIWEGQTVVEVAEQLGHSTEMCLRAYAGVFAEFSIEERVSAEQVIRAARAKVQPT